MSSIHIDEVFTKGEVYPLIVNFQNGYPSEKFKTHECLLLRDEKNDTKTIAVDVAKKLYTGIENQQELGKTLILARNKKTGKVRLIEVGNIEVKPEVQNDLESTQLLDNSALELGRKFGSKKYKQRLEQTAKLKQNEQAVVAQMANVSQNLTQDQLDVSYDTTDSDNFYIPPINREATSVNDVYSLDAILSPEQYNSITGEISNIDLTTKLCPFVQGLMRPDMSDKHKVLALYASSLYNVYSAKILEISKKSYIACYESITLNKHILENFYGYVNGKRCRPLHFRDKSIIHMIVFLLLINNYKFNFDEFCRVTKSASRTMSVKIAMCGAYVVPTNNLKMAQLKLPLNKPPIRRKSNK